MSAKGRKRTLDGAAGIEYCVPGIARNCNEDAVGYAFHARVITVIANGRNRWKTEIDIRRVSARSESCRPFGPLTPVR